MDKILELKKHLKSMTLDAEKFFLKKNNSAGIRARKKLQKGILSRMLNLNLSKKKRKLKQPKQFILVKIFFHRKNFV